MHSVLALLRNRQKEPSESRVRGDLRPELRPIAKEQATPVILC